MSALVPYNQHNFTNANYFQSHRHKKKHYHDKYFMNQQLFIPRPFPTMPYYPSYPFQLNRYPIVDQKYHQQYNTTMNWTNFNQTDVQHRYAQYIHHLNQIQKQQTRREAAVPTVPSQTFGGSQYYYTSGGTVYIYEKETRYVPYPFYYGRGSSGVNVSRSLPYEYRTTLGFNSMPYNPVQSANVDWNLPPKIRVIFMPMNSPPAQPSCTNALSMPPFLFNRMAQPFCSLPLPPPLPNVASLSLTPAVQQIVAQQYSNPVAVLPFTQNFPVSQSMVPYNPQYAQPQQQFFPPMLTTGQPSMDYVPSSYIPPTLLPSDMPLLPANMAHYPYAADASALQIPYANNGHSNTCRACIPAPPSLNVPVAGYNWVQHCSACHHVPADATNPNSRLTNGRFTPLLRHPVVNQQVYSAPPQFQQQQQQQQPYYPYINAIDSKRPWSYPLPPLPPGAIVISDQYLPLPGIAPVTHFSYNHPTQFPRVNKSSSKSFGNYVEMKKTSSKKLKRTREKAIPIPKSKQKSKSKSSTSSSSSIGSSSCSLCNAARALKQTKSSSTSVDSHENFVRKELTPAAKHIELRYAFQPPDLQLVYNNNDNLISKSSNADTTSLPDSTVSLLLVENSGDNVQSITSTIEPDLTSNVEEEEESKSEVNEFIPLSHPVLSDLQQKKRKLLIIREYSSTSPSNTSSVSSFRSFNRKNKEFDAVSTTSTIKMLDEIKENMVANIEASN